MKTKLFLLLFAMYGITNAQYSLLHEFNGTDGDQPYGSVVLSANNSVLYGMSLVGIFSLNTDGSGFTSLHDFTLTTDGASPYGSLILSGNVLYGMTFSGGQYHLGTIFSINTDGSNYTIIHDFIPVFDTLNNNMAGGNPYGTLTISGNILYGTTYGSGGFSAGNIFSIRTDGTGYTDLFEFDNSSGNNPGFGALTLSGNVLYGTTMHGWGKWWWHFIFHSY